MPSNDPVVVTGASGFIAQHLILKLLESGFRVRGTFRGQVHAEKLHFLNQLVNSRRFAGQLTLHNCDLFSKESLQTVFDGCKIVFHTAAPVVLHAENPAEQLEKPAVLMTECVFEACTSVNSTVERLVCTSSVTSLVDIPLNGVEIDETFWNHDSTLTKNPYKYAKTKAEMRLWEMAKAYQNSDAGKEKPLKVLTILPALTVGPVLNTHSAEVPPSLVLVFRMMNATLRSGVPNLGFSVVDVEDVVAAHIGAATVPEAEGRYIMAGKCLCAPEILSLLRAQFPEYQLQLPKRILPSSLAKIMALLRGSNDTSRSPVLTYATLITYLDKQPNFCSQKAIRELGLSPLQDPRRCVVQAAESMISCGAIPERRQLALESAALDAESLKVFPLYLQKGGVCDKFVQVSLSGDFQLRYAVEVDTYNVQISLFTGAIPSERGSEESVEDGSESPTLSQEKEKEKAPGGSPAKGMDETQWILRDGPKLFGSGEGSLIAHGPCQVRFCFSNKHAWWRAKSLTYRVWVEPYHDRAKQ
jgi:nucleoside-diphosphate-sugar epimerase